MEIDPPVLSNITLDALNVDTLSAMKRVATVSSERLSVVVVKFVAFTVSEKRVPVLIELAITVFILRYPLAGANIFPVKMMVDAIIDDVLNCVVLTALENVAVFAAILEIVRRPNGFVMAVELNRIELTSWACMLL